jgi:hypothetical protein
MLARSLSPVLSALVVLGGLSACVSDSTQPNPDAAEAVAVTEAAPASLTFLPPPVLWLSNPWAGKQVKIRDWTGDQYDRCLGPVALPGTGVRLQAQLCYPASLDALQWFTVVGFNSFSSTDRLRVALRSVYNPAYCVDVAAGTANGGEALQFYPCHYGANQLFHLPLPATATGLTSTGRIFTRNSNYAMVFEADAPNAAGSVKPAWQRANNAAQNYQLWSFQAR